MKISSLISHLNITYSQLLVHGIHVGHSFANSILYSAWLVYSYTQNILIINLYKTFFMWKIGLRGIAFACRMRSPIWFINLDQAFAGVIRHMALDCGEFCWTHKWIHGLISNYITLNSVYTKLQSYSSLAHSGRQKWVQHNMQEWILTRKSWPRATFVSSVYHSYWPVRESLYFSIPCFGVVDTNTLCHFINMPLPGNDESMECMVFYNSSISNFILSRKFVLITSWL